MISPLGIGVMAITMAVVAFSYAVLQPELAKLRSEEMRAEAAQRGVPTESNTPVFDFIERTMDRFGLRGFTEAQLAQAGIKTGATSMMAIVLLVMAGAFLLVQVIFQSLFLSFVAVVFSPFFVRMWVSMRTTKRKAKFNEQMAEAMTLLSSALKSGMNVPTALANTATEMDAPMGEELARIVNETRLGRDMVQAMRETAERMGSDDFLWVTEAVAIQRESGGRLSEILDRVTATISERNELRQKIASLAAEGKASAAILMAMPVVIGILFALINPTFVAPLVTTGAGRILLVMAAVLYAVGGFWLSRITKVKL